MKIRKALSLLLALVFAVSLANGRCASGPAFRSALTCCLIVCIASKWIEACVLYSSASILNPIMAYFFERAV